MSNALIEISYRYKNLATSVYYFRLCKCEFNAYILLYTTNFISEKKRKVTSYIYSRNGASKSERLSKYLVQNSQIKG